MLHNAAACRTMLQHIVQCCGTLHNAVAWHKTQCHCTKHNAVAQKSVLQLIAQCHGTLHNAMAPKRNIMARSTMLWHKNQHIEQCHGRLCNAMAQHNAKTSITLLQHKAQHHSTKTALRHKRLHSGTKRNAAAHKTALTHKKAPQNATAEELQGHCKKM